jgi:hypothetical protein
MALLAGRRIATKAHRLAVVGSVRPEDRDASSQAVVVAALAAGVADLAGMGQAVGSLVQ